LTEVGLYSLGYKLAGIVDALVSGPFNMAWQWQQFEMAKHKDAAHLYGRVLTYQLMVAVFVGLGVSLLAHDALKIMCPPQYWAASVVVPIIALSYIIANIRVLMQSGILISKTTRYLGAIAIPVAAFTLLFNYLLIPRFQAMGAAVATALAYLVSLLLCYVIAQRVFWVKYQYGRGTILLGTAATIFLASTWIHLPLIPSILANLSLLGIYVLIAFAVLDRNERAMFHLLVGKAMQLVVPSHVPSKTIGAVASEPDK
jgi:O-antigen/teichoic acid export membrane protein